VCIPPHANIKLSLINRRVFNWLNYKTTAVFLRVRTQKQKHTILYLRHLSSSVQTANRCWASVWPNFSLVFLPFRLWVPMKPSKAIKPWPKKTQTLFTRYKSITKARTSVIRWLKSRHKVNGKTGSTPSFPGRCPGNPILAARLHPSWDIRCFL